MSNGRVHGGTCSNLIWAGGVSQVLWCLLCMKKVPTGPGPTCEWQLRERIWVTFARANKLIWGSRGLGAEKLLGAPHGWPGSGMSEPPSYGAARA